MDSGADTAGPQGQESRRSQSKRIRYRSRQAYPSSSHSRPLRRSRHRRQKLYLFWFLLTALFATILITFLLVLRNPGEVNLNSNNMPDVEVPKGPLDQRR